MSNKRTLWIRSGLILVGIILGLLIVCTRSFFITGVILPKVSESTGISLEASSVHLSFGGVSIKDLDVQALPEGGSFNTASAQASFSWVDLLNGDIIIDSLDLVDPHLILPLRVKQDSSSPEGPSTETSLNLDLQQFTLQNGTIQILTPDQKIHLKNLNLDVSRISPGQDGSVILTSGLKLVSTKPDSQPQQGTTSLEATYSLNDALIPQSLQGKFQVHVEALTEEIPAFTLEFTPELSFDPEKKLLRIQQLSGTATQGDQDVFSLQLKQPTQVDVSGSMPTISDTSLALRIPGTPTRPLPFSSFLPVQAEHLSAELDLIISDNGNTVQGTASVQANDLSGLLGYFIMNDTSATLETTLKGTRETITLETLNVELSHPKRPLFSAQASGTVAPSTGAVDLALPLLMIDSSLSLISTEKPLPLAGSVTARGRVVRSEEGQTRFNVSSIVQPHTTTPETALFPIRLSMVGESVATSVELKSGRLQWEATEGFDNTLTVRGGLEFETGKDPSLDIITEATSLDLTPWQVFIDSLSADEKADQSPHVVEAEVTLPFIPLEVSSLTLDLGTVKLNDLVIDEADLHVAVAPRSFVLHPASITMNGTTLSTSSSLVWEEEAPVFSTSLNMDPMEIQPLFDVLLPNTPGAVQGVLSLDWNLTGAGVRPAEVLKSLKGRLDLSIVDGQIRLFAPVPGSPEGLLQTQELLEKIIRTLAVALAVSPEQLLDPPIEKVTFKAEIENETLELDTFLAENPEFRLTSTGQLPFQADDFSNAEVGALPVSLGVSTNIAQRVRIYREDRLVDGKIMLPPLVDIKGTLASPEIDVRKRVIGGLVITGVTERNKTGNEKVDAALGILGGLLSGEGPPPTPTPLPEQ